MPFPVQPQSITAFIIWLLSFLPDQNSYSTDQMMLTRAKAMIPDNERVIILLTHTVDDVDPFETATHSDSSKGRVTNFDWLHNMDASNPIDELIPVVESSGVLFMISFNS